MNSLVRTAAVLTVRVAAFIAIAATSASGQPTRSATSFQLTPGASFGWDESPPDSALSLLARPSGGVLGRISDFAAESGHLFVLDGDFRKISVFDNSGRFRRNILGGRGEGPGEFMRPRSITSLGLGSLAVLDQGLARITVFDTSGSVRSTIRVPMSQPSQMIYSKGRYYLRRFVFRGEPNIVVLDVKGVPIDSAFPGVGRLADFVSFGENGALGLAADRTTIVYAHPAPGLWSREASWRTATFIGKDLFPDERGRILRRPDGTESRGVFVSVRGIAELDNGLVAILAVAWSQQRGSATSASRADVALFDSTGQHLGNLDVADNAMILRRGFAGNEILIAFTEPYPHIRSFVIHSRPQRQL